MELPEDHLRRPHPLGYLEPAGELHLQLVQYDDPPEVPGPPCEHVPVPYGPVRGEEEVDTHVVHVPTRPIRPSPLVPVGPGQSLGRAGGGGGTGDGRSENRIKPPVGRSRTSLSRARARSNAGGIARYLNQSIHEVYSLCNPVNLSLYGASMRTMVSLSVYTLRRLSLVVRGPYRNPPQTSLGRSLREPREGTGAEGQGLPSTPPDRRRDRGRHSWGSCPHVTLDDSCQTGVSSTVLPTSTHRGVEATATDGQGSLFRRGGLSPRPSSCAYVHAGGVNT